MSVMETSLYLQNFLEEARTFVEGVELSLSGHALKKTHQVNANIFYI